MLTMQPTKLSPDFYRQKNTRKIARQLLGKFLCTCFDGQFTSGMITETEAYEGTGDRGSHAFGNKRTTRTSVMYEEGGLAYVYLCYGLHRMFNIVTHTSGNPHAILVRAIQPVDGTAIMEERRKMSVTRKNFSSGPGTVCKALGIELLHNALDLSQDILWIEDRGIQPKSGQIRVTPRIGIDYAGEDALRPNRFVWITAEKSKKH